MKTKLKKSRYQSGGNIKDLLAADKAGKVYEGPENIQKLGDVEFDSNKTRWNKGVLVAQDLKSKKDYGVVRNADGSYRFFDDKKDRLLTEEQKVKNYYIDFINSPQYYKINKQFPLDTTLAKLRLEFPDSYNAKPGTTQEDLQQASRRFIEQIPREEAAEFAKFKQDQINAIKSVAVDVKRGSDSGYDHKISKRITIDPQQYKEFSDFETILSHEIGHRKEDTPTARISLQAGYPRDNNFTADYMKSPNEIMRMSGGTHDARPWEYKADVNGVRYLLYKNSIYDPINEAFSREKLDKLKSNKELMQNGMIKRLFKTSKDEDKFIEALNNISSTHQKDNVTNAQTGGDLISQLGYRDDSPFKDAASLNINSPFISMENVSTPLFGVSNQTGETKLMKPNKKYKFKNTTSVTEVPAYEKGGLLAGLTQAVSGVAPFLGPIGAGISAASVLAPLVKDMFSGPDNTIVSGSPGAYQTGGMPWINKDSLVAPQSNTSVAPIPLQTVNLDSLNASNRYNDSVLELLNSVNYDYDAIKQMQRMVNGSTAEETSSKIKSKVRRFREHQTGGDLSLSSDAFQVRGNPQQVDGNHYPTLNAHLDHNEVVANTQDGQKFVFSADLKDPNTGKPFAELASKQERAKGKAEKILKNNPYDEQAKSTISMSNANLNHISNIQEAVATALGHRNPDGSTRQSSQDFGMQSGGSISQLTKEYAEYLEDWRDLSEISNRFQSYASPQVPPNTYRDSQTGLLFERAPDGKYRNITRSIDRTRTANGELRLPPISNTYLNPLTRVSADWENLTQLKDYSATPKSVTSSPQTVVNTSDVRAAETSLPNSANVTSLKALSQNRTPKKKVGPIAPGKYDWLEAAQNFNINNPNPNAEQIAAENAVGGLEALLGKSDPLTMDQRAAIVDPTFNQSQAAYNAANIDPSMTGIKADGTYSTSPTTPVEYKTPWTLGDTFKGIELLSKGIGAFGKAEKEQPLLDNTQITQEVYDPSNALYQAQRGFNLAKQGMRTSSVNLNRAMMGSALASKYNQDNQTVSQYQQMNQGARSQFQDRIGQQRRFNTQSQFRTNEVNAANRAAQDAIQQNLFTSMGQFGEDLNRKRYASDIINLYRNQAPDVFDSYIKTLGTYGRR